jgi:uncharacterized cofD-like protein
MDRLRIVGIGGGTGLPVLLAGLRKFAYADVSAIVTVADNGGSSGRLRDSFGIPAVGDLRNCMVALSGKEDLLAGLFQHRFHEEGQLDGHALGNLIVTALYQQTGSLKQALEAAGRLLPMKGLAMAATETPATLCALFEDGSTVRGEWQIAAAGKDIQRVWLEPENPTPSPGVLEALQSADAIVLAPGSLFTSLAPNLLVAGVADAIRKSEAVKILVCNLTTQPGETDGFTASGHLRVVESLLGPRVVQFCLMNSATARVRSLLPPGAESEPVVCDTHWVRALGAVPIKADLLAEQEEEIRHDPAKLGSLIISVARNMRQMKRLSEGIDSPESRAEAPANRFGTRWMRPRHRARKGGTAACQSGFTAI